MTDRERSLGNIVSVLRVLLPYKRAYWKTYFGYITGLTISVLATGVTIPLIFRSFIDLLSRHGMAPAVLVPALWMLIVWIGVLTTINVFALLLSDLSISFNAPYVQRDMDEDVFSVIHRLSYAFFSRSFVGALVAKAKRFSEAADAIDMHLSRGMYMTAIQFIATIVILWSIAPLLSALFVLWGAIFIGITIPLVRWKMTYDADKARNDSLVTAALADSIGNFLAIKMFAQFDAERRSFHGVATARAKALLRSWLATSTTNVIHGLFIVVMQIIMLGLALVFWQKGIISVGTVVLVQTYVVIVGAQFTDVGNRLKYIQRFAAECMEMIDIMREQPDILDPPRPQSLMVSRGAIQFDHVSFRYGDRDDVFEDFSLSIQPGEKIGLVGYSGGGKTTLIRLLMRFADVTAGAIRIDGQDIRAVMQDDLRRSISYVPQDTILFHRSIRANIAYAQPDASDAEIRAAARNAFAEEFIDRFPDGYDTIVGERGIQLSGGERQRVAIARALLKRAPILVLDEATSSLDSVSEAYIQEALRPLMHERTTIVIAHRLSTIRLMDRIVVLDKGRVVADGTHETLLAAGGIYAELHAHQTHGMITDRD